MIRLSKSCAVVLRTAAAFDPPAPPWSVAWFSGIVNKQNGHLDEAIKNFESILTIDDGQTRRRELDFSEDTRLLNQLGQTMFERALQERGSERSAERNEILGRARNRFARVLELDPENVTAHYNLSLLYDRLGDRARAATHRDLHAKFKVDDNARDRAITAARIRYPAANHAAETIVIRDLQRDGAYELPLASDPVSPR